jgi:hypothetical protein
MAFPGYLDRYLAHKAVRGQQTREPVKPNRPDNLERPITAVHRTRGSFSAEAGSRASLVPGEIARLGTLVAGALLMFGLGAGFGWWRRTR